MKSLRIKIKDSINPGEFTISLTKLGYENIGSSTLGGEGEFAKRGNLIDIWLERYKLPVRIDLINERIENIYLFNPITQGVERRMKEVFIVAFGLTPKLAPAWFKKAKFPSGQGKIERLFLSEVKIGDLVVHIDHGIGKFVGLDEDDLIVEYSKGDKLSVPTNQMDRLTKYIGVAGHRPRLNTLGTSGWEKIKARVTDSIVDTASELLTLYARRELIRRPPFQSDTPWQKQMEESFEFIETIDQKKATVEIKKDLEGTSPMDRVLVGDVGFGKTEIAMRTAFKVVQENKQVAVLVPTTLLSEQHFHVFRSRFKNFPIKVAILSRFRSISEQKNTIRDLSDGSIDILIGTHRILSKDVVFKNLGLLIIDEEHRFGVGAKEQLKKIKQNLDVLSMSATPIPRTFQMSLTSLRNLSVLHEAPSGREKIQTSIRQSSETLIKETIDREISRGGQVYFLHNRVQTIAKRAIQISKLVPEAKIAVAHGQMKEQDLEKVMDDFYNGNSNILVCTSIIGSGIDMANVNTIIIEDAQNFGLSDLHQLRGRVGRSNKSSFALLLYPRNYSPQGDVLERFLAIKDSSELGSGFSLARKDLEIRGAGNILGNEQSGNISLVGFDLFLQLLNQTIEKMKESQKSPLTA